MNDRHEGIVFPMKSASVRRGMAKDDVCPECGSHLDTGYECNAYKCGYDAMKEAMACTSSDFLGYMLLKHTEHCAKRLVYGDGQCECGASLKSMTNEQMGKV